MIRLFKVLGCLKSNFYNMKLAVITTILTVLTSCSGNMPITNDLKSLNLKGHVKRVDIITQTSIPISEWFYSQIDFSDFQSSYRDDAIYSFIGNSTMEFSESGMLENQIVYNGEGNVIFQGLPTRKNQMTLYQPINININELSDGWSFNFDEKNRIIQQTTSHNGEIFLDRHIKYDNNGDIDYVVCEYAGLKMESIGHVPSDTTFFHYIERDTVGNWTKAIIEHKGRLTTDSYRVNVKRKITYYNSGDSGSIVGTLKSWNAEERMNYPRKDVSMTPKSFFNSAIEISMPQQMQRDLSYNVPNSLLYRLNEETGFFSMTITKVEQSENIYQNEPSKDLLDAISYYFGMQGTVVLKWYDYRNNAMINSNRCVYMKYALYASAGYLSTGDPVITEFIQIQPEVDGIVYTVAIGYDSYHSYLYGPWAEKILNTINIK